MHYVYVHTVPNGKIYIGQTKDILKRWSNGEGYAENKPFYDDIRAYGWNNIRHEIIAEFEDREQAEQLEAVLIALMNSENNHIGYNQTKIYSDAMRLYTSRIQSTGISLEKTLPEEHFFEPFNLPISACEQLINQWIFNEKHRNIMKRRLLDGLTYQELSEEFKMSVRQLKAIVYNGCDKLEKRM